MNCVSTLRIMVVIDVTKEKSSRKSRVTEQENLWFSTGNMKHDKTVGKLIVCCPCHWVKSRNLVDHTFTASSDYFLISMLISAVPNRFFVSIK